MLDVAPRILIVTATREAGLVLAELLVQFDPVVTSVVVTPSELTTGTPLGQPSVIVIDPNALDDIPVGAITDRLPGVPLFPLIGGGLGIEEVLRAFGRTDNDRPNSAVRAPVRPSPPYSGQAAAAIDFATDAENMVEAFGFTSIAAEAEGRTADAPVPGLLEWVPTVNLSPPNQSVFGDASAATPLRAHPGIQRDREALPCDESRFRDHSKHGIGEQHPGRLD